VDPAKAMGRVLSLIVPLTLISVILGPGVGFLFFGAWLTYGTYHAVRWALKVDKDERITQTLERSFFADVQDIERRIGNVLLSAFRDPKSKSEPKPPAEPKEQDVVRGANGSIMRCIICGENANKDGFFCDLHDEGNPWYKRPPR